MEGTVSFLSVRLNKPVLDDMLARHGFRVRQEKDSLTNHKNKKDKNRKSIKLKPFLSNPCFFNFFSIITPPLPLGLYYTNIGYKKNKNFLELFRVIFRRFSLFFRQTVDIIVEKYWIRYFFSTTNNSHIVRQLIPA